MVDRIYSKYTVIKNEDIEKYLNEGGKKILTGLLSYINHNKEIDGKTTDNNYYIVNTDEPYAEDVLSILQYTEKTGKEYGCIEILSKEQKESREYLRNYSTDDNYFDEEYS